MVWYSNFWNRLYIVMLWGSPQKLLIYFERLYERSGSGVILSQTSIFNSIPFQVFVLSILQMMHYFRPTCKHTHSLNGWKKEGQTPGLIFLRSVALLFFQLAGAHQNRVICLYILLKILMLILTHEPQKKVSKYHYVQKAYTLLCNFSAYAG